MTDKRISRHCSFLNAYVAIHMKYENDKADGCSCEEAGCENSKCNLSRCFAGDRSAGKNFLDFPKK